MRYNLHTHTPRCRHAVGSEREYIENAIKAGMDTIGFSDHAPILFPDGFVSPIRMLPDETEEYVSTLQSLRNEYREQIQVLIGFEMEYYPSLFAPTIEFLSQFSLDYLILGQHYLENEIGMPYVAKNRNSPADLTRYVDQCCAALETGRFTYVAHPDVFRFDGDPGFYDTEMARLCRKALETETPLELNLVGVYLKRHYPGDRFWSVAGRVGNQAVIGMDAHDPQALFFREGVDHCLNMAKHHRIAVLDSVPIRSPF